MNLTFLIPDRPCGEIEAVSRIFAEKERLAEKKAQEADLRGGTRPGSMAEAVVG